MATNSRRRTRGGAVARSVPRGFDKDALRAARDSADLKRPQLCREAKVGIATLKAWENGVSIPQIDTLREVLAAMKRLGIDVSVETIIAVPEAERTLADWRAIRLMLQPELAAKIPIGTTHLSNIEAGAVALTDRTREGLAEALGLSPAVVDRAWELSGELHTALDEKERAALDSKRRSNT